MASERIDDPGEHFRARREAVAAEEFNEFFDAAVSGMPEAVTPELVAEYVRLNGRPT